MVASAGTDSKVASEVAPAGFVVTSPAVRQQRHVEVERLHLRLPGRHFGPVRRAQTRTSL